MWHGKCSRADDGVEEVDITTEHGGLAAALSRAAPSFWSGIAVSRQLSEERGS